MERPFSEPTGLDEIYKVPEKAKYEFVQFLNNSACIALVACTAVSIYLMRPELMLLSGIGSGGAGLNGIRLANKIDKLSESEEETH